MEDKILYIKNLDLGYLEERLIKQLKWSVEDSKEAVRRYKNFLILACKYPGNPMPPPSDIDEAWHNHILYTREYMRDCEIIFGRYLHHAPFQPPKEENSKKEMENEMDKMAQIAARLYRQEFQESYSLELDVALFW